IILGAGGGLIDSNTAAAQPTIAGVISGSGALTFNMAGTQAINLAGVNTYTGGTTIIGPSTVVAANNNSAFGSGILALNGGRLISNGYLTTLANNVTVG